MKFLAIPSFFLFVPLFAQTAPSTADDPVVVTIEGKPYKKSELETFVKALPQAVAQNFYANKRGFLETFALLTKLTTVAEQEGLDKTQPHQARLTYNRMQYLATAELNEADSKAQISEEDIKKYYETKKAELARAKTKVLYVAYNNNPMPSLDPAAKKPLTEEQAKAKGEGLLKQARAGADFVKLIRENSDDADSKAKDGDFPPFKPTDQSLPADIQSAIFALKPGEYSNLLRQPNGFYIFRLESLATPQLSEIRGDLYTAIKKERLDKWVDSVRKSISIQFNNEKYLTEPAPK
jgi:peptidyl-prolyl cis-trans isomerase C